jgi:cytoskeletal protein CcmA (bactofilin family)
MRNALPATEITALLGRGTHFEGKLHFEGRVRIDGTFRGEIRGDDALVIGDGAEVVANIEAGTVIVKGGSLEGNVRAAHSIELYVPARASGTLHAPEVHIEKGVQFAGTCTIGPLDAPAASPTPDAPVPEPDA